MTPVILHAGSFQSSLRLKVFEKGKGDVPDRRIGFAPTKPGEPLHVPSFGLWYVRPMGALPPRIFDALVSAVERDDIPGLDFSNRWDIDDAAMGSLSGLTSLRLLDLGRTRVTDAGLSALSSLNHLEVLSVSQAISDQGLMKIPSLKRLRELNLAASRVTDAGMESLAAYTRLEVLHLDRTVVTAKGLECLIALPRLNTLILGSAIGDSGASAISRLESLRILDVSQTVISDQGIAFLAGRPTLRVLYLNRRLTDKGLVSVGKMARLESLDLTRSAITDRGLSPLAGLRQLRELALTGTAIGDKGIAQLSGLKRLEVLELSQTRVTGAVIPILAQNHPRLKTLALPWPRLSSENLSQLTAMPHLKTIFLNGSLLPESVMRHLQEMARLHRGMNMAHSRPVPSASGLARQSVPARTSNTAAMSDADLKNRTAVMTYAVTPEGGLEERLEYPAPEASRPSKSSRPSSVPVSLHDASSGASSGLRQIRLAQSEADPVHNLSVPRRSVIQTDDAPPEKSLGELDIRVAPPPRR